MPRYLSKNKIEQICEYEKLDKLVITPRPWYRACPILKQMLAYRVGDRVEFHIHVELSRTDRTWYPGDSTTPIESLPPGNNRRRAIVYGKHPNKEKIPSRDFFEQDFDYRGHIITSEGDVEYGIEVRQYHPILLAKVTSSDTTWSRVLFLLLGAIISCLSALAIAIFSYFVLYKNSSSLGCSVAVEEARQIQRERFDSTDESHSASPAMQTMRVAEVRKFCKLDEVSENLVRAAMSQMNLSVRGCHRVLKLARTIADLAGSETIQTPHVAEAFQYRSRNSI